MWPETGSNWALSLLSTTRKVETAIDGTRVMAAPGNSWAGCPTVTTLIESMSIRKVLEEAYMPGMVKVKE
jgi:hypothetical protein